MADEFTQENPTAADLIADLDLITELAQRVVLQRNELHEALTSLIHFVKAEGVRVSRAPLADAIEVLSRCKQ